MEEFTDNLLRLQNQPSFEKIPDRRNSPPSKAFVRGPDNRKSFLLVHERITLEGKVFGVTINAYFRKTLDKDLRMEIDYDTHTEGDRPRSIHNYTRLINIPFPYSGFQFIIDEKMLIRNEAIQDYVQSMRVSFLFAVTRYTGKPLISAEEKPFKRLYFSTPYNGYRTVRFNIRPSIITPNYTTYTGQVMTEPFVQATFDMVNGKRFFGAPSNIYYQPEKNESPESAMYELEEKSKSRVLKMVRTWNSRKL